MKENTVVYRLACGDKYFHPGGTARKETFSFATLDSLFRAVQFRAFPLPTYKRLRLLKVTISQTETEEEV